MGRTRLANVIHERFPFPDVVGCIIMLRIRLGTQVPHFLGICTQVLGHLHGDSLHAGLDLHLFRLHRLLMQEFRLLLCHIQLHYRRTLSIPRFCLHKYRLFLHLILAGGLELPTPLIGHRSIAHLILCSGIQMGR